jgi:hypothetical protein
MRRLLFLLFVPFVLNAQTKYVINNGNVSINKKEYKNAVLTYTFDKRIEMTDFSIAKLQRQIDKATRLRVDYKENGQNKSQTFLGKMPKVAKVKAEPEVIADVKPKEEKNK